MITLQNMPQEILIGILKNLDKKSLCKVGETSSLFNLLSADKSLWSSFIKERFPKLIVDCRDKKTYIKLAKKEHAHFKKWKLFIKKELHYNIPDSINLRYSALYNAHKAALIALGKVQMNTLKVHKDLQPVHEEILSKIKGHTRTVYFGKL